MNIWRYKILVFKGGGYLLEVAINTGQTVLLKWS